MTCWWWQNVVGSSQFFKLFCNKFRHLLIAIEMNFVFELINELSL